MNLPAEWKLDPARCALLVIDMQNDFVSPGGFHHRHGKNCAPMQAIIPNIQRLLRDLPREVKRIYVVTGREPDGSDSHWRFHRIRPETLSKYGTALAGDNNALKGSWGAEIIDLLKPGEQDCIINKRRYSAFFQTDLEMCLRCWGIDTLLFSGVATEVCVESTLRDAFFRDLDVIMVKDAVASWDKQAHEATLRVVGNAFGAVLSTEQVVSFL